MIAPLKETIVVYLLHFCTPLHGYAHYVGKTTQDRIPDRMREHAAGRGAIGTTPLRLHQVPFYLAAWIATVDPELERRLIDRPDVHAALCPVCHDRPGLAYYPAITPALPPVDPDDLAGLSFRGSARHQSHLNAKKAPPEPRPSLGPLQDLGK